MALDLVTSRCLVSQEMTEAIKEGIIKTPDIDLESRIQSSSFEPIIGDEVWVIDTETGGLFRPEYHEPIYRTLLQLPGRRRQKHSLINGFELKEGFSYLFKLEEKFTLPKQIRIKASPKSSQGRIFDSSKFMADYNGSFNKVASVSDDPLESWLFVQPLKFNLIAWPGLTFNQLRFSVGNSHKLTDREIEEEYQKNPMLFRTDGSPLERILNPLIQDGLGLTLDLKGVAGIVGLKARKNYIPIDLKAKGKYEVEDYFEPIEPKNGSVEIKPNDCGLFFSKESISIPAHLNAELKDHSDVGISGPLHFAGFFDNNFNGCCVFEIRSGEVSPVLLSDGMPISELQFFRCNVPDKLYGAEAGSHYQDQVGPRVAKYFKEIDFMELGRKYQKLNKNVLVLPKRELLSIQDKVGFEFTTPEKTSLLEKKVNDHPMVHLRFNCENDEEVQQIIPYVLILNNDKIFYFVRTDKMEDYGDKRLSNRYSIGVGGHIHMEDGPDYLINCIKREVFKEEVKFEKGASEPIHVGMLTAWDEPVDRVHFGAIYVIQTDGNVVGKEKSIVESGMIPIQELMETYQRHNYETWSKKLIPLLPEIKNYLSKAKTI
jgi:dCTP deaminase